MIKYAAAALLSLAMLVAACGGGDKKASPTAQPAATPTTASVAPSETGGTPPPADVPLPPQSARTGVPAVDAVIDAVLSRDTATLRSLVQLRPVACVRSIQPGDLGGLVCASDEAAGTTVDVLPIASCENHYARAGELDQALQFAATPRLYAAYRAGDDYGAVFAQRAVENGPVFGLVVGISAGKLTYVDFGCGQSPVQIVRNVAAGDFLIAPPPTPAGG